MFNRRKRIEKLWVESNEQYHAILLTLAVQAANASCLYMSIYRHGMDAPLTSFHLFNSSQELTGVNLCDRTPIVNEIEDETTTHYVVIAVVVQVVRLLAFIFFLFRAKFKLSTESHQEFLTSIWLIPTFNFTFL